MTIRLWDWEKGFSNIMTFEGHSHYVMMICFNPKVVTHPAPHPSSRHPLTVSSRLAGREFFC